ncbi:MAG: glycosyltransferase family 4 protein [Mojavia pulchra JT2-VF2]|jgi:glycosyltransferase involved in cell wall biosynthesis|uniref:Glycosyltransferase family 4 protein n=1 Tax=Mojavia pulchra JT2-VF2 TaxID=287848 RepID=A0A951PXZ9_9NOST|nr:glycosyltransferase family 4 protein [Mojavia pulchra JT2-VF2]
MHILIAALHRPTKPTGVCRHAANLARCLADTDKISKVTLVIGSWQKDYFESSFSLKSDKIAWVNVDIENRSVTRNIWFLSGLPKLAKQLHADLVHLAFPLPFFRQLLPCPVVATIHDLYPYEYPKNFGYPNVIFNQLFLRQCVNNSDGLSCVSKYTLERLKNYFPHIEQRKKTAVVYNYVDFSQVTPKVPNASNVKLPFLLSVAQHRKNKNLDILIQAYYLLLKNHQIADLTQLIIVGSSGPETDNILNQIQALSLANRVLLMTSIDDDELCWLYNNCDLLVVPSSTEGFCLPLAEALYLACKVVCSDIPIFREIGNHNCTYFELQGDNSQNLAQAIINCLSKPDYDNNVSDQRFSKLKVSQQYLDLYAKMLKF